jgi:glyoxylase-like metal-dependent hydrolase (beta-lactamase superfamily II)
VSEPAYSITALRYGTVTLPSSELFSRAPGSPEEERRMDFFFWLLENEDRAILVDTGFSESGAHRRGRTMLCEPTALLRMLRPQAEFDSLLLTHLHYDHAGNLEMASGAPIAVSRRELDYWNHEADHLGLVDPGDLLRLAEARERGMLRLLEGREEIAPGVVAEEVGGHTPGQLIVYVRTAAGRAVLASDALHFFEEMEGETVFAATIDAARAARAIRRLGDAAQSGTQIVPGHDPLVCERFPAVSELAFRVA